MLGRSGAAPWIPGTIGKPIVGACRGAARPRFCARGWGARHAGGGGEPCYLAASTVPRGLDRTGVAAQARVPGPWQGIAQSEELGTDGLWARLRGGATRVVLLLADSVTGLLWPLVVAARADQAAPWHRLFARARLAGLDWPGPRGAMRDGAQGLSAFLGQTLGDCVIDVCGGSPHATASSCGWLIVSSRPVS